MRKIFKNVVFAATTSIIAATSLQVASCTVKIHHEAKLSTIDLSLTDPSVILQINQEWQSQPVSVKCYDQDHQEMDVDTICEISFVNGMLPEWISFDNINRIIQIKGIPEPETYVFNIIARDTIDGLVISTPQTFVVEVVAPPYVPPDEIRIGSTDFEPVVFISTPGDVKLSIDAYNQEFPQEVVDKDCQWEITRTMGSKIVDKHGYPLFRLNATKNYCQLITSTDIDDEYDGTYTTVVKATSIANPSVTDTVSVVITLAKPFYYKDVMTNFVYTRKTFEEDWSLSLIPQDCMVIKNVKSEIYNIPVCKVADNLCTNSGVKLMYRVELPQSIYEIGRYAFNNMQTLGDIAMPGVKIVRGYAFTSCLNMKLNESFQAPQLSIVEEWAFNGCASLVFPDDLVHTLITIGDHGFATTGSTRINLGSAIEFIDKDAFSYCNWLDYIDILANNPPTLGGQLYVGTTKLIAIRVPLNSIEKYKTAPGWSIYQDKIIGI